MLRFQQGNGQMANNRENMVVHTGKQTSGIISRPFFIGSAFMLFQRHDFKAFIRGKSNPFVDPVPGRVDVLGKEFTNPFPLLPGLGKRNLSIRT